MPDLGTMTVNITGQMSGLSGVLGQASSAIGRFAQGLGPISIGAAVAGVAMVGLGIASTKAAADFQAGMTTLITGAGESQKNIKMVSDGILQLAVDTGTSTKQLTDGMYMIESAGYHGAAGLNVLKIAAQGARVGNADLGTVANALTTVLTDYHMKASDAASAMNALTTTVANGKTHLQDLASALGNVLPLASALGVSFPQVAGAMAVMTNAGLNARRAAMNLNNTLRSLSAPSSVAQKSMQQVGLSAQQLKDTLSSGGLTAAIQLIEDHVGKKFPAGSVQAVQAFKNIMGGATGYNVALMLGGKNMAAYQQDVQNISAALSKGGSSVQGWALVQQDFNFKMDQTKQAFNVLLITIGSQLLPALTKLLTAVTPLIAGFADWLVKSGALQTGLALVGTALSIIATVVGEVISGIARVVGFFQQNEIAALALLIPLGALGGYFVFLAVSAIAAFIAAAPAMIAGFLAGAAAAWTMAAGVIAATWPFLLIGAIVGLVVAGIILAIQHWGAIVSWLKGVWSGIVSFFSGLWASIQHIFSGIGQWFADRFTDARNKIQSIFGNIGTWIGDRFNDAKKGVTDAWTNINAAVKTGSDTTQNIIGAAMQAGVNWFQWLYNHNYYFKDFVDFTKQVFTEDKAFIEQIWSDIATWLANTWNTIKSKGESVWNAISTFFTTLFTTIKSTVTSVWTSITSWISTQWQKISILATVYWTLIYTAISAQIIKAENAIKSVWTAAISWLQGEWNQLAGLANAAWAAVGAVFNSIWSRYIAPPLNALWSQISGWFSNLANLAYNAGANFVHMLANGISSAIGSVISAASGVAGQITSILGFHSPPPQGPAADSDQWMPNFIAMLSSGLFAGQSKIAGASAALASSLAFGPSTPSYTPSSSGAALALSAAGAAGAAGTGTTTVVLQLDGQTLAQVVASHQDRLVRAKFGPGARR